MRDTPRSPIILPPLQPIAEQAVHYPDRVFTSLAHLIDVPLLHEAYPGPARTPRQAWTVSRRPHMRPTCMAT